MYFLAQYYMALGCSMWSRSSRSRAEFLFCCQQLMWMNLLYSICEGCKRRGRGGGLVTRSSISKRITPHISSYLFLKVLDYDDRNSFLSSLLVIHSIWPVNRRMVSCDVHNGRTCHNALPATQCTHAQDQAPYMDVLRTVIVWRISEKLKQKWDRIICGIYNIHIF